MKQPLTEVLALIPARSGSKGIPHKNVRLLNGKPLIAHSIAHGLTAALVNRVIVSTDSEEYAEIARRYGAEIPFLRPTELAGDKSTDLEAFHHALTWLQEHEGYTPDICVHLRPTYPIRHIEDIDNIIQILIDNPGLDSVRSIAPAPETPFKMWFRDEESGRLTPVIQSDIKDAHSMPRQSLPQTFLQNACVDAVRTRAILEQNSMTGTHIHGYVMEHNFDIDTELQLASAAGAIALSTEDEIAQKAAHLRQTLASGKPITFCFDIDGIIANLVPDGRYTLATPKPETVSAINRLYDKGYRITLFTARGTVTGLDWHNLTHQQMAEWGVKHHELILGKPAYDYVIDDKMLTLNEVCKLALYV